MRIHGVILAGGKGTRLRPLTDHMPKPLLRVGKKTMIEYPLMKLVDAGVTTITIVRQARYADEFDSILNDAYPSVTITYADHPEESYGMPYAINLAKPTVEKDSSICVLCADVLFDDSLELALNHYRTVPSHAVIIAAEMKDTAGYSHILHKNNHVNEILPKDAERHLNGIIDLGAAIYPYDVFEKTNLLYPSDTEVPVTDLNNKFLRENRLQVFKIEGWWSDVGKSIDEYNKVNSRYEYR